MIRQKLIDTALFRQDGSGIADGIFQTIYGLIEDQEESELPWLTDALSKELDNDYYLIHSGEKFISNQYAKLIKMEQEQKILNHLDIIARTILNKFGLSWNKIYSAINTDYKPLENYDMSQKETPNVTHTKTVKQDLTTQNDGYGFNSSDPVHVSKSRVEGAKLDNEEESKETGTRDLTRHGNIGVTTSQQMLQSEIDLRSNYQFVNQLFNDVDSILCLLVY